MIDDRGARMGTVNDHARTKSMEEVPSRAPDAMALHRVIVFSWMPAANATVVPGDRGKYLRRGGIGSEGKGTGGGEMGDGRPMRLTHAVALPRQHTASYYSERPLATPVVAHRGGCGCPGAWRGMAWGEFKKKTR